MVNVNLSGTNSFHFKYPELKDIVTSYGDTTKKTNFSSGGGEGNDSPSSKLMQKQIERRNLAYLFLSSCKPTPFITCESSAFARTPNETFFGGTAAGTAFNYKGGHYAKSIIPFVKSQGLVKLPKLWVFGMGAVMWRWKTYMGVNTDDQGNIRWRSPGFENSLNEGEKPIGIDPIAQPGHPSTTIESNGPLVGIGNDCGKVGGASRNNRSATYDNAPTISFTNSLFNGEKGLWATPIITKNFAQTSCFAASTMKIRGLKEAVSFGQITTFGIGGGTKPGTSFTNVGTGGFGCDKSVYTLLRAVYGAAFDYWGVYNNDGILSKTIPQAVPWDWNKSYENNVLLGQDNPDWPTSVAGPLNSVPYQGDAGGFYYDRYWEDIGFQKNSKGTWTAWQLDVGSLTIGKTGNNDSLGGSFSDGWYSCDNDEVETDSYDNIILTQMKSAKEASCHTYMPMLWAPPWCHFYAEPVNTKNSLGPARKDPKSISQTSIPDSCFTTIPIDTPFRDYVGNFGYLGNRNSNYAAQSIGSTVITKEYGIPSSWTDLTKNNVYYGGADNTTLYTSFFIKAAADTNATNNVEWEDSLYFTEEGGKYAELMALLPSFVKEKFVEEFEKWCDGDWKDKYLKVIDPVNFDWPADDDGFAEGPTGSLNDVTLGIYKRKYTKNDLLGNSYRLDSLNGEGSATAYPFSDIIGQYGGGEWIDKIGNTSYHSMITLNKTDSNNKGKINLLEEELVKDYYYAMIATPKLFGLDVFNGDNGGENQAFYANKRLVRTYTEAFQKEWKENWKYKQNQLNNDEIDNDTSGSVLDDNDVKLAMYRSFKSIVDKWISSTRSAKSGTPKYFFNILQNESDAFFDKTTTPLAGHFSYVNRVMGEIGNKAVLDVIPLDKIVDNPKMSLYNLMADLLGENKFDFFPLPSFTNFTNNNRKDNVNKTAEEMFTPFTSTISKSSGPQFICMYVGGTSRILDLSSNKSNCKIDQDKVSYNDDGMSLPSGTDSGSRQPTPSEYARPMSEEPLAPENEKFNYKDDSRIEGKGYTAFRVAYGLENQNMFKSIEVDQAEFSETNESLMVIDAMAKKGDPADRTQKGNNLHNVYLTRSYTCKVESLGNMTIQPLQYFELTNVPMFYGTYLITEVSHNMKPHHITTSFKGTRQPIATVPVVEDVATAMNLSLKDIKAAEGNNNVLNGGFGNGNGGGNGGGCEAPNTTISNTNPSVDTVTVNGIASTIQFVDVGKDNKDLYINHAWKQCSSCEGNGLPGEEQISYRSDGSVKKRIWVAYNQPMEKMTVNKVEYIALHWTGGYGKVNTTGGTLKKRGLHYHFEIDTDGTLFQLCDLERKAYHGSGLNNYSIGISYAGGTENNKSGSAYVRTVDDWNKEDLNLNGRNTYNAKKQFLGLLDACTLAVQKYPGIKYLTSHQWFSSSKSDVGDKFPWNIFLNKLKERGIDLQLKYDGTAPSGASWVANRKPDTTITGDVDLSVYDNASEQETEGNANQNQGQQNNIESGDGGGVVATNINRPNNVNESLNSSGKI
jgi:N-acetyl-anhydromuramyl-L-alanine amidase AmpD